ncbi:zinc transporter ZupT [gut metagenome]|uniref:Zinc transporter ZupT n=1 Tax=gut metagenome TaxID=749906 RepID=J9GSX9_9ZZZZ
MTINNQDFWIAFGLTLIAGLSTGIGSLIAFLTHHTNTKMLSGAMGLSAGVMIYVSFMELMPEAVELLSGQYAERLATAFMLFAFFAGIGMVALIDRLVPEDENPHEIHLDHEGPRKGLKRTGLMMALAIGIHNFPEGLAAFASALADIEIALPIVFAIAIHNIPEGVAVSVPIYHATGSRKKAFAYSFLSGMAEPLGAVLGYLFLLPFWTSALNALLLAFVSGIMVYISFDELLPGMEKYGHHHLGILGVVVGMSIMAFSLLLF